MIGRSLSANVRILVAFALLASFINFVLYNNTTANFKSLHLAIDVSNGLLSLLLALFLWGNLHSSQQQDFQYLALGFAFAAGTEILHALVGIEWFGSMAWIMSYAGHLRPATWPPSTYVLPIGMAWSLWLVRRQSRLSNFHFSLGMAALTGGLLWLSFYLPTYRETGFLAIQRPTQFPLLFLLAGVTLAYYRYRHLSPLFESMALLGGFLFLSDLAMLYSTSPHERFAMMAHVNKLAGYGFMHVVLMRMAADDGNARIRSQESLRESEQFNRTLFETSPIGLALARMDGTLVDANPAYCNIIGRTLPETLGLTYWEITPSSYAEQEKEQLRQLAVSGRYGPYEKEYIHKDGHRVSVRLSGCLIHRQAEQYIWSSVEDITVRRQSEQSMRLAELVYENSSEGVMITDVSNKIIAVNPAFEKIMGYSSDEVKGLTPELFSSGVHDPKFYDAMWNEVRSTGHWQGEVWEKKKNGELMAKLLTINAIHDEGGGIDRYVALFSDITQKKRSEELIWKQANFDTLTSLPNRDMFRDRLKQEVVKASRDHSRVALLLIDLDHFKEVNDTLGHDVGDTLLQEAAQRILGCVRESDTVSRLGGDEFTVVISERSASTHLDDIAKKLIERLAAPYQLGAEIVHVSASVGISLFPDDATDLDTLMKNADQAMYMAKSLGRNRFGYFTPAMQQESQNRLRLSNELHQAMERQEFVVHYQPQINLETGWVTGLEALVRWQHPTRGLVFPDVFISIAEENGLILPLGEWVMATACHQLKQWRDKGMQEMRMSVNLSARQFRQATLAATVSSLLIETGLNPASLELEITESLAMDNPQANAQTLAILRETGVELAIDDFGTGHSSLGYLKDFPITRLKLDRSFIMNIETEPDDAIIVTAAISLAHDLGLQVVAEGVEDEAQVDYLTRLNCDDIQGYFFSKPMPAADAEMYVRKRNALPCLSTSSDIGQSVDVMVIDDDESMCKYLAEALKGFGHRPYYATDPVQGLEYLRRTPDKYELIMVDMLLPNMSGIDLVKQVRQCCRNAAIVVISATRKDHVIKTLKPIEKEYGLIPGINYFVLEKPPSVDSIMGLFHKIFMRPAKLLCNAENG